MTSEKETTEERVDRLVLEARDHVREMDAVLPTGKQGYLKPDPLTAIAHGLAGLLKLGMAMAEEES